MVIPVGRLPARRAARSASSRRRARSTSPSRRCSTRSRCPGQRARVLDWPYVEGLRIDEAMHPLTLLAVGPLRQDAAEPERRAAAPGRAVEVRLQGHQVDREDHAHRETQPPTTWNLAAPDEYGFYANVNPAVDHPRWSQATERRIGELRRRPTLPFNGYAEQVAEPLRGHGPAPVLLSGMRARRASRCPGSSPASSSARSCRWRRSSCARRAGDARREPDRAGAQPARPASRSIFLVAALACTPLKIALRLDVADPASAGCSASSAFFYAAAARPHVRRARPGPRLARDLGRRHEAQVHLRRLRGVRAADPAGGDVDQRRAQAPRLRALEAPAPARVRRAASWR